MEFSSHPSSFINGRFLNDLSICDRVIEEFKISPSKEQGRIGSGIDISAKKSTDCMLHALNKDIVTEYILELNQILEEYIETYPAMRLLDQFHICPYINVQHYKPGEGFYNYHAETTNYYTDNPENENEWRASSRVLTFMTYLNDVTDGGGTEFLYQNVTTSSQKGLTIFWPPWWTHFHRGIISPTQEKYIITGWYNFLPHDHELYELE